METEEEWKDVRGFPRYRVSNLGRVQGPRGLVKPVRLKSGHYKVTLYREQESRTQYLGRLILKTFVGDAPSTRHCVRWLDGDISNNILPNLEWSLFGGKKQQIVEQFAAELNVEKRAIQDILLGKGQTGRKRRQRKITFPQAAKIIELAKALPSRGWTTPRRQQQLANRISK